MVEKSGNAQTELFSFSTNFLRDHAGQIINDPKIAITELIANAYDAGATAVDIVWPDGVPGQFVISDNGTGMTPAEFNRRWKRLSYERLKEQGTQVEFPPGVPVRQRTAFGRNGKGRHAAFCFADEYLVETRKAGNRLVVAVSMTAGGDVPFRAETRAQETGGSYGPGTTISAELVRGMLDEEELSEVLGNRFIVDPSFVIQVNNRPVKLFDLQSLTSESVEVPPYGRVEVHILDAAAVDKSSKLKGLTWWINDRMVGEPSWEGLDGEGSILDGRTSEAKRFSFIIQAPMLRDDVKSDWSGFHSNARSNSVNKALRNFVSKKIYNALADSRKSRKKAALDENRQILRELPDHSKQIVAQFVEEVQESCPRLSDQDLARTVQIYAKLEQSRTGYDILKKLAACSPDDLDGWNSIMDQWSATNANLILSELGERLRLLSKLQNLINNKMADEVHDLQPLFERGLWMFGPEYEAVDFRSNRGMAEVIGSLFNRPEEETSRRRPDFVALTDSSIGAYAADNYGESGETFGYRKVLIVELKRGGFTITQGEMDQAREYIKEIRKKGCVDRHTRVEAYILGSLLEEGLEQSTYGEASIMIPMRYDNLLTRAHVRTFNLQRRLEAVKPPEDDDPELRAVIGDTSEQVALFAQ